MDLNSSLTRDLFISCDWGTSSFRLRAVDRESSRVLAERRTDLGIAAVFEQWRQTGQEEVARVAFYQAILLGQIQELASASGLSASASGLSLKGRPLIVSGMASSSLGMLELPYKELPLDAGGHDSGHASSTNDSGARHFGEDLRTTILPATDYFPHPTVLISGVRTADDVMRGEETQLIGCLSAGHQGHGLFIFPGTHSKHIQVRDNKIVGFTTYMTGEFFHLLSQKSILSGAVTAPNPLVTVPVPSVTAPDPSVTAPTLSEEADDRESFEKGVADSQRSGLLHSAFLVRTQHLFGHWSREANYHYLSGLLIGEELKEITRAGAPVTLVCSGPQRSYYSRACTALNITVIDIVDADEALVRGQLTLYDLFKSLF
jgi:2-dehydro-3-deoxygalactonokinase